jgi:hypothetical protein
MPCHAMPCHAIPYHTLPYHTIPYHTIPYHTLLYLTILYLTQSTGPYYPCALVGPIVIGTAVGSLGQFFPADKGLSAVTNGLPWPIQVRSKLPNTLRYNSECSFYHNVEFLNGIIFPTVRIKTLFTMCLLRSSNVLFFRAL